MKYILPALVATLASAAPIPVTGNPFLDSLSGNTLAPTFPQLLSPAASTVSPAASTVSPAASTVSPAASTVSPAASSVSPAASSVSPAANPLPGGLFDALQNVPSIATAYLNLLGNIFQGLTQKPTTDPAEYLTNTIDAATKPVADLLTKAGVGNSVNAAAALSKAITTDVENLLSGANPLLKSILTGIPA